jgi:type I restriction enzyme S subunit
MDSLLTKTKRTRGELWHIARLIERYKQAILAAASRGELTSEWRVRFGKNEPWYRCTVEDVAEVVTGSTPPTKQRSRFLGGDYPFFKPTDLDAGYNVVNAREFLTTEGVAVLRPVPAGSTLVTCIGATIGKTGFARVDCCTNQQINALVPDRDALHPEWLFWRVIASDFFDLIIANSSSTTLPIINKGRFKKLPIEVPTVEEQREIVRRIEAAFGWIDRIGGEQARAADLAERLDEAILTKAFRGELVMQDPNGERS